MSIHERPAEINQRQSLGYWECDLVHFSKNTKTNLITLRERYSRYMITIRNRDRHAESTANKIIDALEQLTTVTKSLTFDNGVEFARHEKIAKKLAIKTYFCEPYKSYQKGSIENGNKQLREWFPRELEINLISQYQINSKINLLNQRPMKCLGYRTSIEVLVEKDHIIYV